MYQSALALVLFAAAVQGAPRATDEIVLDLDPAQTEIHFTLSDVLHIVHGTFQLKSGTVRFDPATGKASGAVVVDVTSGASGSTARDRKMHKDILESQRYPEAVFTPERVEGRFASEGVAELHVRGLFKIHGAEHEMTFQTRVENKGDELVANLHSIMPYPQWGMKNPSTFILRVSDKVQLDIRATGHIYLGTR
ncbi:MAG TPA: YceI family protein [Bryobacteraceae bacterium]|nr:YceI family protein [Bryobacteraceae bacterium]